jgi:hypothetical protein
LKKSINETDFIQVDDERNVVRLDVQSQLEQDEITIPGDHIVAICNLHVKPDGENGVAATFTEASFFFVLPVPSNIISEKLAEYRLRLRKKGVN